MVAEMNFFFVVRPVVFSFFCMWCWCTHRPSLHVAASNGFVDIECRAVGAATVTTVLTVPLFGLSSDTHA